MSEGLEVKQSVEEKPSRMTRIYSITEKLKKLSFVSPTYLLCQDYVTVIKDYYTKKSGDFEIKFLEMTVAVPICLRYLRSEDDKMIDTFLDELEKLCEIKK